MRLECNPSVAAHLDSATQRARVITEDWIATCGYCLACESRRLAPTPTNTPARDFRCEKCSHSYELKSSKMSFGSRIVDGAYASMMRRIKERTTPTLLLLEYSPEWSVRNLTAIHHSFLLPSVIQCRPPLAATARRAGWVGCNILLAAIPPEARVSIIEAGRARHPKHVRSDFEKPEKLSELSVSERNWAGAVLRLIHETLGQTFTVQQAYSMEEQLSSLYPGNNNVRAKIRQQLQVLRDAGILLTEARGIYKVRREQLCTRITTTT